MLLAAAIGVVLILLGGFFLLTMGEAKREKRLLAPVRARLDVWVMSGTRILRKMHMGGLSKRLRIIGAYLIHECVHGVLLAVRALERLLTKAVRSLRERHNVR